MLYFGWLHFRRARVEHAPDGKVLVGGVLMSLSLLMVVAVIAD